MSGRNERLEAAILDKLTQDSPSLPEAVRLERTRGLLDLPSELQPNLTQWLRGGPFSEVLIREKYSLRTVLAIRRSADVSSALLDLSAYARDGKKEYRLWQVKA